jgi:V-type H+-transporting ATPase subunit A
MLGLQRRPRLVSRPSLFELITKKNIEDLSDLGFLQHHLGLPDLIEDIDDSPYSSKSFVSSFPVPIQALHSTARTIRMPSKESGIGDNDQNGSIFAISGPVITAENMIGVAMYELVSACQSSSEDTCLRSGTNTFDSVESAIKN